MNPVVLCVLAAISLSVVNGNALSRRIVKRQDNWNCEPNKFYCGDGLFGYANTRPNSLYKCNGADAENSDADYYVECDVDCANTGAGKGAYCTCEVGAIYCGHELYMGNFNYTGLQMHSLYQCDASNLVHKLADCPEVCKNTVDGDSVCVDENEECTADLLYCSSEIRTTNEMGNDWNRNTLWRCNHDKAADKVRDCPNGCVERSPHSYCDDTDRVAKAPPE